MMAPTAAAKLAEQMTAERFAIGDARSSVYKLGFHNIIISRATGAPMPRVYAAGTVQFDAYYAGVENGRQEWALRTERERAAA